jgi:hypothetical protein
MRRPPAAMMGGNPEFGADLSKQTEAFENAYGAKVITEK